MKVYRIPARYAPYLYDMVKEIARNTEKDADFREDDDERVRRFAIIPNCLIDETLAGEVVLTIGVDASATTTRAADGATNPAPSTSAAPGPGSARASLSPAA